MAFQPTGPDDSLRYLPFYRQEIDSSVSNDLSACAARRETVRAAETTVAPGLRQVRLQRHEAREARVPQRGQRLAHLPVALARRHHLARRRQRVLDLKVDEVRAEQVDTPA